MIIAIDIPDIIQANFDFKEYQRSGVVDLEFNNGTVKIECHWNDIKGIRIFKGRKHITNYQTGEIHRHLMRLIIL